MTYGAAWNSNYSTTQCVGALNWRERFRLRLSEDFFTMKSRLASAATCATTGLPTSKGTTRLPSEMAIQIMRQHIRTRNFHPINSQTEKARLFAKQAVLRGQASLSEGNLFP